MPTFAFGEAGAVLSVPDALILGILTTIPVAASKHSIVDQPDKFRIALGAFAAANAK